MPPSKKAERKLAKKEISPSVSQADVHHEAFSSFSGHEAASPPKPSSITEGAGLREGENYDEEDEEDEEVEMALSQPSRFLQDITTKQKQVALESVSIEFHGHTLLDSAKLFVKPGSRYGLIGKNGVGKTTLLRFMETKRIQGFPQGLQVLHVQQEIAGDDTTVLNCVIQANALLFTTKRDLETLNKAGAMSGQQDDEEMHAVKVLELSAQLEELGGFDAEERARKVLRGLGFTEENMSATTKSLSGGWRMRVAIGRALFLEPDLLLLDEPTNHLDLPSRLWLADCICSLEQTIIVVSHDRAFLDAVTTDTIWFKDKKLRYFPGNYTVFQKTVQDLVLKQQNLYDWQERQLDHMEESIQKARKEGAARGDDKKLAFAAQRERVVHRFGAYRHADGSRWKYGMSGYKQKVDPVKVDPIFDFKFEDPALLGVSTALLQLREVSFRYLGAVARPPAPAPVKAPVVKGKGKAVTAPVKKVDTKVGYTTKEVNFSVTEGSRIGIIGRNGSGKSTLLNLLVGSLQPTEGEILRHHNLKIGYYTQHHVDSLDMEQTAVEHFLQQFGTRTPLEARSFLGKFGLTGELPLQPMRTLSGGQKSRVVLASLLYRAPHILVLDEPTNHLDIETIDALGRALKKFKGGVILVSHDEALITDVSEELWVIKDGRLNKMEGTFNEYREEVLAAISTKKKKW